MAEDADAGESGEAVDNVTDMPVERSADLTDSGLSVSADAATAAPAADDLFYEEQWEEEAESNASGPAILPLLLLLLGLAGWTGFFLWANAPTIMSATPQGAVELIVHWSMPAAILMLTYLLFMRNSTREAHRFTSVAARLRDESNALETRLATVNAELTASQVQLAEQSESLATLGQSASERLAARAEEVQRALAIGLEKMEQLEVVGSSATRNLEQLREHLPVVTNNAKDVTNQIGSIGRAAHGEMNNLIETISTLSERSERNRQALKDLNEQSAVTMTSVDRAIATTMDRLNDMLAEAEQRGISIGSNLSSDAEAHVAALGKAQERLAEGSAASNAAITAAVGELEAGLARVAESSAAEEARVQALAAHLTETLDTIAQRLAEIENDGTAKAGALNEALSALDAETQGLVDRLATGIGTGDLLTTQIENLRQILAASVATAEEELPPALERLAERAEQSRIAISGLTENADELSRLSEAAGERLDGLRATANARRQDIAGLERLAEETAEKSGQHLEGYRAQIEAVRGDSEALAESAGERLAGTLASVRAAAEQAGKQARETLDTDLAEAVEDIATRLRERIDALLAERVELVGPDLEAQMAKTLAATQTGAERVREELTGLEQVAVALEARAAEARAKAEKHSEEVFSRQVALMTDSLNSIAIDVTKLLSTDVTDTEWANYLKGDRSIFARRAVKLLDNGEARDIASEYQADPDFREHVNRYIHDFEMMLRFVLGSRDGHPVAVTMLSSDVGKLYVALAQAIDRLRN